ncbi:DUF2274 domain-containing protein [Variovorax sp. LT1R16]|uniref:DUF2274 domain-containing protein n=1 Tax=Variovorax sp. LT1R16 TaxID=3443728 RepID=UPI003F480FD7
MSAAKLRLGPLPKAESVKLTVTLSAELKATLDRYAALHAQTYGGQTDAAALVPHMLLTFMARDRAFKTMSASGPVLSEDLSPAPMTIPGE